MEKLTGEQIRSMFLKYFNEQYKNRLCEIEKLKFKN